MNLARAVDMPSEDELVQTIERGSRKGRAMGTALTEGGGFDLLSLVAGVAVGVVGTIFFRRAVGRDLSSRVQAGGPLEGRVLDKLVKPDWLLLKVETERGVLLATFTQMPEEIDRLVDTGDTITLDVRKYQPTLEDPPIGKVRRPTPPIEPENLPARIGAEEDPRGPHTLAVGLAAQPPESQVAA
jgi:hypothetical protein